MSHLDAYVSVHAIYHNLPFKPTSVHITQATNKCSLYDYYLIWLLFNQPIFQ